MTSQGFEKRGLSSNKSFTIFLLILVAMAIPCLAQQPAPPQRIEEIRIVGNRRIPESTILYYIQTKENDPYNEQQILRDFRALLRTNFFSDAKVYLEQGETGVIVILEVRERPLIRSIEYEGMKSFKESDVLERFRDMKVGLTVDSPLTKQKYRLQEELSVVCWSRMVNLWGALRLTFNN